jgi:hypothetical protein
LFSFLLACKEDDLTLGFRKDPKNFAVFYRELPVDAVVFMNDSLSTYNTLVTSTTNRLLAGSYNDPDLGKVTARFYTQFRPDNTVRTAEADAVFDSVSLKLRFDLYHYGANQTNTQLFEVRQIAAEVDNNALFFNNTELPLSRGIFGRMDATMNPLFLDEIVEEKTDTTLVVRTKLEKGFGQLLFDSWVTHDSTFIDFLKFKTQFFGLAVIPETSDMILGFDPLHAQSKLVLHYHYDTTKRTFEFGFNAALGFTQMTADRSNTGVADLLKGRKELVPANGKAYVQSGVGIFTKISMQSLVNLRDTVPNLAFNSVELQIPVEAFDEGKEPPATVSLRLVKDNNYFAGARTLSYQQYLLGDANTDGMYVRNDLSSAGALRYDSANRMYRGFITQFAQALVKEADPEKSYLKFVLYPFNPDATKSVDRFVFDRSQIKLKVYYTKPLTGSDTE